MNSSFHFDMPTIRELKKKLQTEGFTHVFVWTDKPGVTYNPHAHKGKVSFYITRGEVTFSGGINRIIKAGERFDVPPNVIHSALVGPEGCDWVVGEEIEGDT